MEKIIKPIFKIAGDVSVPGDKSISHRALMFGSICNGEVSIANLSIAEDCQSTLNCLRALGVQIKNRSHDTLMIKGKGLFGFEEPTHLLDAGNSGTTIRLLSGLLAGQSFYSVITGDTSLRSRPMKRIIDPLRLMGASIFGRCGDTKPPLTIIGKTLKPIEYTLPVPSAQVKSAILMAGLYTDGKTTVIENAGSRDHTERLMAYLGAKIENGSGAITIARGELAAKDIHIPGDISSAIYFIVAAILSRNSRLHVIDVGLNPTRMGAIDILQEMGADITITEKGLRCGELYGDIRACSSELHGINIAPRMIPSLIDEVPILSLCATQASGTTSIEGAGELRFKESDRLKSAANGLNRLGADLTETKDGLIVKGPTPLSGSRVNSNLDHRLAMTFAIAGLIARNETIIENPECIAISFPNFFEKLQSLIGDTDGAISNA